MPAGPRSQIAAFVSIGMWEVSVRINKQLNVAIANERTVASFAWRAAANVNMLARIMRKRQIIPEYQPLRRTSSSTRL